MGASQSPSLKNKKQDARLSFSTDWSTPEPYRPFHRRLGEFQAKKELLQEIIARKPAGGISYFNIVLVGQVASGKSSFLNTCTTSSASILRTTNVVYQKSTKSVTANKKQDARLPFAAVSLFMEPYGTLEEVQTKEDFLREPLMACTDKMGCVIFSVVEQSGFGKSSFVDLLLASILRRIVILEIKTQDERDTEAEPLMIRQIEHEMFQWYIRKKELQIYHENNAMQGIDFLCFEVFNALPVKESRSDNNGDRKLEILKEKRRELDKEIKENLQQCILLLIGMRRRNQMQKRQVATI